MENRESLQIDKKTKLEFEKERLQFREKNEKFVTQDEFLIELIKQWKKS